MFQFAFKKAKCRRKKFPRRKSDFGERIPSRQNERKRKRGWFVVTSRVEVNCKLKLIVFFLPSLHYQRSFLSEISSLHIIYGHRSSHSRNCASQREKIQLKKGRRRRKMQKTLHTISSFFIFLSLTLRFRYRCATSKSPTISTSHNFTGTFFSFFKNVKDSRKENIFLYIFPIFLRSKIK